MATFSLEDVRAVCKRRDAWWTVLLVDPLAIRLTRVLASRTSVTPDQVTTVAFALGIGAAGCFTQGTPGWLALGALLYHLGFVLDCCDGKMARLKGCGSPFGGWLDFMLDRVRDTVCAMALAGGLYASTGRSAYLWVGCAILALDMFRYLNGSQIGKARRALRRSRWWAVSREERAEGPAEEQGPGGPVVVPPRPGLYGRIRAFLKAHRIRTHLVSGIEFQMAAFIVGPLTGKVIEAVAIAGGLLFFFEVVLIVRFWRWSRRFRRIEPLAAGVAEETPVQADAVPVPSR
ncbi:CDP-alcohol phosphatidyltransferase family protein [Actinomadura viridis]|uniref:CDP-alcohol phosphatidyltransferase family protein n=1 Tax=Actinomadura viridis TaxID=58110 RepID=UPI003699E4AE